MDNNHNDNSIVCHNFAVFNYSSTNITNSITINIYIISTNITSFSYFF